MKYSLEMCLITLAITATALNAQNPPDTGRGEKGVKVALRTNTLYDIALTPNIGLELGLGRGWSIGGNVLYGWWSDRRKFYWRDFSADIGVRKYFGKKRELRDGSTNGLTGHHVGLYAGITTYDFELGGRGYISDYRKDDWSRYAGFDYGYSLPVAKSLSLDFTVGVGYVGGRYREYLPAQVGSSDEWHYEWQATKDLSYFGPTRLEVSLVWVIDIPRKKKCNYENE